MNSQSLRIGLAGLGRLGSRYARLLVRHVPRARLEALCSTSTDEPGRFAYFPAIACARHRLSNRPKDHAILSFLDQHRATSLKP